MAVDFLSKIPHREPFLFLDRVDALVPFLSVEAFWDPSGRADLGATSVKWMLAVEAMAQAAAVLVAESLGVSFGADGGFVFAKIYDAQAFFLVPYAPLKISVDVRQVGSKIWKFVGTASADGRVVCRAEFAGMVSDWAALSKTESEISDTLEASLTRGQAFWHADAGHVFFKGHFPAKPIVPGVLVVDAMLRLRSEGSGSAMHVQEVAFRTPIVPGNTVAFLHKDHEKGFVATAFVGETLAVQALVLIS